jgi:methenyltetrahydromethanopterin cyclohydrolase
MTAPFVRGLVAVGLLAGLAPLAPIAGPAHAIVGRPMTPVSYAGVARRTTYRAAAYTTTAVAVSASTAAARQCYTRYDSYGRAVTTCY